MPKPTRAPGHRTTRPAGPSRREAYTLLGRCPCFHVRRAARVITNRFDEALGGVGLRATQFEILSVLELGCAAPPTVRALADTILLEPSAVSRAIAELGRRGLVSSVPGEDDRRERVVLLTEAGRRAYRSGFPRWKRARDELAADVGERSLEVMVDALTLVADGPRT